MLWRYKGSWQCFLLRFPQNNPRGSRVEAPACCPGCCIAPTVHEESYHQPFSQILYDTVTANAEYFFYYDREIQSKRLDVHHLEVFSIL